MKKISVGSFVLLTTAVFIATGFFVFNGISGVKADDSNDWCNGADMNHDGTVDGNIVGYTNWYNNYGNICSDENAHCNGADVNTDGIVDQADYTTLINSNINGDYTIWYNNYGRTDCDEATDKCNGADLDKNGIVDQADYTVWYNNVGQTGCKETIQTKSPVIGSGLWCEGADMNKDGTVDQADYTVWYNHYGEVCIAPDWCGGSDTNTDGVADQADYTIWYNNYGQTGCVGDTTLPTVTLVASDGQLFNLASASPQTIKITFSEDISNIPAVSASSVAETVTDCADSDAKTFCFDFAIPIEDSTLTQLNISGAQDLAGNTMTEDDTHSFTVDTVAPIISLDPYTTTPTNQDILVTAHTNEGTLNADTHTFSANGSFDFVATDVAGNATTKTVSITNIDKVAPKVSSYTFNGVADNLNIGVVSATNPVTIVINTNEDVKFTRIRIVNSSGAEVKYFTQDTLGSTVTKIWKGEGSPVAGIYTIKPRMIDAAGNITDITLTNTITIANPKEDVAVGGGSIGGEGGGGLSLIKTWKVGDINKDGVVDDKDYSALTDLNNDGVVDEYDLAILMANWGR